MITEHYPRFLESKLIRSLENSPAVFLQGPRQCGKTTLAKTVLEPLGYGYVDCSNPKAKKFALEDPLGFIADLPERAILDEAQHVPELFASLRGEIDRHRTNGRFLLTGSSNILLLPRLSDSMAGRVLSIQLYPLSMTEINRKKSCFLDNLFGKGFGFGNYERLGNAIDDAMVKGGYPVVLGHSSPSERRNWLANYLDRVVFRDMEELFRISQPELLGKILEMAAEQTAGVLSFNGIATQLEATMPTVKRYMGLLEQMFLLDRLRPWHLRRLKRQVRAPKLHIGDTGLACALLNANADVLSDNRPLRGQLMETFVYQELKKQASWQGFPIKFHHYRHMDRAEVDIVMEGDGRKVAGVEVKASATVGPSDFKGLKQLAEVAGKDFAGGVVLYDGESCFKHRGCYAVPVRQLWEAEQ